MIEINKSMLVSIQWKLSRNPIKFTSFVKNSDQMRVGFFSSPGLHLSSYRNHKVWDYLLLSVWSVSSFNFLHSVHQIISSNHIQIQSQFTNALKEYRDFGVSMDLQSMVSLTLLFNFILSIWSLIAFVGEACLKNCGIEQKFDYGSYQCVDIWDE